MKKRAFLYNRRILLEFPFDMKLIKEVKGLVGCEFRSKVSKTIKGKKRSKQNVWLVDCIERNINRIEELKFDISPKVIEGAKAKKVVLKPVGDIEGLNATLYPYQSNALSFVEAMDGRALLAMSPGTGKTITSLAYVKYKEKKYKKTLIIVLSSVKTMWERETKKWIGEDSQVLYTKTPYPITENIVIVNFDLIDSWKKELKKYKFDTVIIDEAHVLGNPSSKRTKAAKSICKDAKNVISLTGTPLKSRVSQLLAPIQIINKEIFPNRRAFEKRYCKGYQSKFGWNATGASNLKELNEILTENVMYRIRKEDVFKDAPKVQYTRIPVDIERKEYDKIQNDFENWLLENKKATVASVLTQISPLRQESLKQKVKLSEDWIEEFLKTGEKLVVFCVHKKGVSAIMEKFKKIAVKVDGSLSSEKKQESVDKFVNNDKIRLIVGNIQSMSTGIDGLQTVCNNMLFLENSYVPSDKEQAVCRLDRIGQKYSINCYDFVAVDTIDEHILNIIEGKKKIIDRVVEGKEGGKDSLSVAEELIKSLK